MNTLLILPLNWKYFSVYSERKDVAQLNEGGEKDWKQIKATSKKAAATKGTLASHIFFLNFVSDWEERLKFGEIRARGPQIFV